MSRRGSSSSGILFLSFLMAVGIVWIKGQERIDRRVLNGIPISMEDIPENLVLPDAWIPPAARVTLQGPRIAIDMIRSPQCGFFVSLKEYDFSDDGTPRNVVLSESMFRTSMVDEADRSLITIDENSIHPRQVSLYMIPWNVSKDQSPYHNLPLSDDVISLPLYRVQKSIPINAPIMGGLSNGLKLKEVIVDPPEILVTGSREAVDRIQSVSTAILDISLSTLKTPPQYMALPDLKVEYNVWPVKESIRGVTVTLKLTK